MRWPSLNRKTALCGAVILLSVVFKFWLIAGMAITDDPADPIGYAEQINTGHPNFFPPGTGWVGQLFRATGLPFREGIELAYLLGCALAVRALLDWPVKSYLALGLFVFMSFNPAAEELFSHLLSDEVWLVEILPGISLFVLFAEGRSHWRWLWLALAAVFLALSTVTRITIIPLAATFLAWAIATLALASLQKQNGRTLAPLLLGGAACLILAVALDETVCWRNSSVYHFRGLSLPDSREYRQLWMTLQSVGEPTGPKYYPVDHDRLELIAKAGPVSQAFVDALATDTKFHRVSQDAYGKYDLALGWFHFVVFLNTIPDGHLKKGFAMFRLVEDEIANAGAEHRLKVRTILPLPDCRLGVVATALPDALRDQGACTVTIPKKFAWAGLVAPKFEKPDFNTATGRWSVEPTPLRNAIGETICSVYSAIYLLMLPAFGLSLIACVTAFLGRWKYLPAISARRMAQQLFLVLPVIFFCWYTWFVASGILPVLRFVVLHNVLMPLLTVYYFQLARQLYLRGPEARPR